MRRGRRRGLRAPCLLQERECAAHVGGVNLCKCMKPKIYMCFDCKGELVSWAASLGWLSLLPLPALCPLCFFSLFPLQRMAP